MTYLQKYCQININQQNINSENTSIKLDENNGNSGNSKCHSFHSSETPVTSKQKNNYRLSLSKVNTQPLTRKRMLALKSESAIQPKRLKLEDVDIEQKDESNSNTQNENCDTKLSDDSDKTNGETLRKEIDEIRSTIATIEKYEHRVPELERLIKKWQDVGRKTIEELKEKIEPNQNIEVILAHFQIDPLLFYTTLPESD